MHLQECLRQIIDHATTEAKYDIANIGLDSVTSFFENYKE
jgi:hypothetical protein